MNTLRRLVGLVPLMVLLAPGSAVAEDLAAAEAAFEKGAGEMTADHSDAVCAAGEKKTQDLPAPADERAMAASDARPMTTTATVGFGVEFTALAAGTVLKLTAPSSKKPGSVRRWVSLNILKVRADGAMMGLRGAF